MPLYIHQRDHWTNFTWNYSELSVLLGKVRNLQGRLMGKMEELGFEMRQEAELGTLTLDVLKTSEIEGEILDSDQVRSSIARRLGMDLNGLVPSDRDVDGIVEMMLDATKFCNYDLTKDRLLGWHSSLFPSGRSGIYKITVGALRTGAMKVVSGVMGREKIHFQAPDAQKVDSEIEKFLDWFNDEQNIDPVIKAGIAHFWFITIHPFDDGNGRIARAITDMQLARSDGSSQRFFSMSAQIQKQRGKYYEILEKSQKGTSEITLWLDWFLKCLFQALFDTNNTLEKVLSKSKFWKTHTQTLLNERQRLVINKLFDSFEGKLTSSKWAKIAKCSTDTALRDIQDLIQKSILKKEDSGGRSTNYELF